MPIVSVLLYLGSGLLLVGLVLTRVDAWWSGRDADALWHLVGLVLGGVLAVLLR